MQTRATNNCNWHMAVAHFLFRSCRSGLATIGIRIVVSRPITVIADIRPPQAGIIRPAPTPSPGAGVIGPTPAPATPTSTPAPAAIAIPAAGPAATRAAPPTRPTAAPTAPASTPITAPPTASSIGLRGGLLIELAALSQGGLRIHLLSER